MASKVKIQPLGDRVLVKAIEEKEQIKGGIIIPDAAKEKSLEAEVVALGTGRTKDDGSKIPFEVKVGDKVPVVVDGGKVAGGHDGGPLPENGIVIKNGKLRGVLQQHGRTSTSAGKSCNHACSIRNNPPIHGRQWSSRQNTDPLVSLQAPSDIFALLFHQRSLGTRQVQVLRPPEWHSNKE